MLFNTWPFAGFIAVVFALYYLPGVARSLGWQLVVLTIASYVFYAWHTPWLILLLLTSTWINAFVTLKLVRPGASPAWRQKWMACAVLINLALLAFFKYASLLVKTFFPESWWSHWGLDLSQIPLPIGISFFTFQGISLVVDLYRAGSGGMEGLRPPGSRKESAWLMMKMAFFKAFFPQLVAGPIVKAHEFMHQIEAKAFSRIDWGDAARKLILGYFFKMVVADNLKDATSLIAYPSYTQLSSAMLLILLYGFSMQIFADFCGYSLIAMGLAKLFGYQLPLNFNCPYISTSITDFWRRWHISLSTWLKQYLYIPLGGNRLGAGRTYLNLMVVMLLGGLWHGAAWSYMVWGGAHGLFLALERFISTRVAGPREPRTGFPFCMGRGLQIFLTFNLVSLLWLLFKLPDFAQVIDYVRCLLSFKRGIEPQPAFVILWFSLPIVAYHIFALLKPHVAPVLTRLPSTVQYGLECSAYGVLLFFVLSNSGTSGDFIYFQF